jgi:CheY-like chemotaxis protein
MAGERQPNVVILEINPPLFRGCHLVGPIRNELAHRDCLIIAVARQADRECRRQCREAGIDIVLSMPVNPVVLQTLFWMESTRVNRLLPDAGRGLGARPERRHGSAGVDAAHPAADGAAVNGVT